MCDSDGNLCGDDSVRNSDHGRDAVAVVLGRLYTPHTHAHTATVTAGGTIIIFKLRSRAVNTY